MLSENFSALATERINPATKNIDTLPPEGIVSLIHDADRTVADAVTPALPAAANIAASAAASFASGARLIYLGAAPSQAFYGLQRKAAPVPENPRNTAPTTSAI